MHRTLIRLRFSGGPLDGREMTPATAAETYRMAGGEYRPGDDDAGCVAVYVWHPDTPARWHAAPAGTAELQD
jgi:hypothetical protein